ncbi:LysR family transcriptional regulator [Vibrio hippocampi]|uniref:HTH-type transcriptional regulator HdfR n=1 Tax=Vibrio hippocampi TaxID=654686 RepID=A0ABM8ZMQ7_9VIBR|nr:LysR family transcriptional regulator [Vibrio hippocampi]CAH0528986.1 HTH-type transcriptional regulator HdfR [Vibrio hippocampi]
MPLSIDKLDKRDLRRLELFCQIVEQEGISNATVSTGLSQPVLSNQLSELEKSLGVKLCQRGRSGFLLTEAGETVFNYANELQQLMSEYAVKLKGVQHTLTGLVRIGILDNTITLPNNPLPKAIEKFYQLSDKVEIHIEVGDYTQLYEKLVNRQLDMMIVVETEHQSHNFTQVIPLFEEKSYLYAREDVANKLKKLNWSLEKQRINIGGYSAELMHQLLDVKQYQSIKLIDGWNVESGVLLTMAGTHLSFLPEHLINNNLLSPTLTAVNPKKWHFSSQFCLVTKNSKKSASAVHCAFMDCLLSSIPKLPQDARFSETCLVCGQGDDLKI